MTEREELEMWKKMYLRMVRGTEDAIELLNQAEKASEALYSEAWLPEEPQETGAPK